MHTKDLCNYHNTQRKERDRSRPKCKVVGCEKRVVSKNMCNKHFNQQKLKVQRNKLFTILGGVKCVQCGYSNELALAFDHIYDDGYRDRKLRTLDFRKYLGNPSLAGERLQVLCANCNHIKEIKRRIAA